MVYDFADATFDISVDGVVHLAEGYKGTPTTMSLLQFNTDPASIHTIYLSDLGFSWEDYIPASKEWMQVVDSDIILAGDVDVQSQKFSKAIIYGGYDGKDQLSSVKVGTPNFGTWVDWFPEIVDQDDLDALADQIIADRNITLIMIAPSFLGVGNMDVGGLIDVSSTTLGISAGEEDWLTMMVMANPFTNEIAPTLSDSFYQGSQNTGDETKQSVRNNEQNIGKLAEDGDSMLDRIIALEAAVGI